MASRSAAAYAEAQKKGIAVTAGAEHGNHVADAASPEDHSTMEHMDHSTMTGMDHSKMSAADHAGHSQMAATDHGTMPGMQHGSSAPMEHRSMPGMQHGSSAASATVVMEAPRSNAEISRIEPAATLRADEFDAPAASAQAEAAKATGKHHQERR